MQKEIIVLSFCRRNLCNVSTSCFHLRDFFSQKWIRLIDSDTKGFHPVYKNRIFLKWLIFSQKEIIFLSFCKSNFSNILEFRFYLENLYPRRKFFWLTLPQKNFILYMKMEYIITYYFQSSYISKFALYIWTRISQGLQYFKLIAKERVYSSLV